MGQKITKLKPVGGFCAETGGPFLFCSPPFWARQSPPPATITGAIIGVGSTNFFFLGSLGSMAGRIVWAWVLTIPAAGFMAALCQYLFMTMGWAH